MDNIQLFQQLHQQVVVEVVTNSVHTSMDNQVDQVVEVDLLVDPGGSGNTPPVSPPQGNNGGNGDLGTGPVMVLLVERGASSRSCSIWISGGDGGAGAT